MLLESLHLCYVLRLLKKDMSKHFRTNPDIQMSGILYHHIQEHSIRRYKMVEYSIYCDILVVGWLTIRLSFPRAASLKLAAVVSDHRRNDSDVRL